MLAAIEKNRLKVSKSTKSQRKSLLGQFLTPQSIAVFMASLFTNRRGACHLLDAGAGIGALSAAFLEAWISDNYHFQEVKLSAFEIDPFLQPYLRGTLSHYANIERLAVKIIEDDFIHTSVEVLERDLFSPEIPLYTHAILNPPYKKLQSFSAHRAALKRVGLETVNLYSAFVSLALAQMAQHGQIVAILPRSFCNGPYYRGFRDYILEHAAIHRIHLFNSRKKVFRDDEVLQENVIFLLERGVDQGEVTVSLSTDDSFRDLVEFTYPFDRIVFSDDGEKFIHVPTSPQRNPIETSPQFTNALDDIGVKVSTGAVIGFRVKEHLRDMPTPTSAPLIYPAHFDNYLLTWPLADIRKPNAIENNDLTKRWLYPTGFYCVVRRFSAKEEKKRIVASVVDPDNFGNATLVGFENHLNVFHFDKRGLSKTLAWGLTVFLNATCVDNYFRRFSGHTQVNATDLRLLKYPSRAALQQLGEWAERQCPLTQEKIDARMAQLIAGDNYA